MGELDYARLTKYWSEARPSILSPYMMDGFGFPSSAGFFRFRAEANIVRRLTEKLDRSGTVLDLGSGIGCWSEHFAQRFSRVVAIERSLPLYEALEERCAPYPNIVTVCDDVLRFEPGDDYDLVFLGGVLMYLNDDDVIALLRKIVHCLRPEGIILCRETTVRTGVLTRQDAYQAVYRSLSSYSEIFSQSGVQVVKLERNKPYILMQMGCELMRSWKNVVPRKLQALPVLGRMVYWGLRLGPWLPRVPAALGVAFPQLENHFYVLQAESSGSHPVARV